MKPQDMKDLRELIEFLKQYQVAEFDLDRGDIKIRLKFVQAQVPSTIADLSRLVASAPASVPPNPPSAPSQPPTAPAAPATDPDAGLHILKSPIVGTFYGSPSPGSPSFISPGDRVEKGQVVGIVEAMKLMNEIEADASGEIVKCFITNGQPVEFGQPLFSIREG